MKREDIWVDHNMHFVAAVGHNYTYFIRASAFPKSELLICWMSFSVWCTDFSLTRASCCTPHSWQERGVAIKFWVVWGTSCEDIKDSQNKRLFSSTGLKIEDWYVLVCSQDSNLIVKVSILKHAILNNLRLATYNYNLILWSDHELMINWIATGMLCFYPIPSSPLV